MASTVQTGSAGVQESIPHPAAVIVPSVLVPLVVVGVGVASLLLWHLRKTRWVWSNI